MDTNVQPLVSNLRSIIGSFIDSLSGEVTVHELEDFLAARSVPTGHDFGGFEPEAYVEDELIYPILEDVLGHDKSRFPYSDERNPKRPDFLLPGLEIIGENKVANDYESAVSELQDYLKNKGIEESFGIATDGLTWGLIRIDTEGDFISFDRVVEINLQPVAESYATSEDLIAQRALDVGTDEILTEFVENFSREGLEHHIDVAPQRFRGKLQGSIEEFYDLYIELLFGEGSGEHEYETTLLDDIHSPPETPNKEERVFAITVVNRLLFIKLLEEGNVLPDGFLSARVEEYEQSVSRLAGDINLYEDQIKPLFYELFNTPRPDRRARYKNQEDWFTEVPYLNGGLFRENVEKEAEYKIQDRILPSLINDLIEGHQLERQNGLDPAVLGNVFEMTINYISGEEGRQKNIGAYYTPGDASHLVTDQTVDEAIRGTLIEAYSNYYSEIEEREEDFPLDKILRWIEDGRRWFGDPEATEEAYEKLGNLKVLDPACGSGHFLTSAVTNIHQARLSVMRGIGWEDSDDWGMRVYQAKEEVVTNSIYGVDIDQVAVEIAKLRVWLKIIEEGYKEKYGHLPNIDLNILSGNSLSGLPVKSDNQTALNLYKDRVKKIKELRINYKQDNEDVRGQIDDRMESIEEELNDEYVRRIGDTHIFEEVVGSFECLSEKPLYIDEDNFVDKVVSVTFGKSDTGDFTSEERDWLNDKGFSTNPAWGATARLEIEGGEAVTANAVQVVKEAFERGFYIKKIERNPVTDDLAEVEGEPFHWVASFPEAMDTSGNSGFDVVIGNPPYGSQVLSDAARVLTSEYETGEVRDVVAPFTERALQLLREGGYYGNVVTLRVLYEGGMSGVRSLLRRQLRGGKAACFARRPTQVFEGCQVRVGIITGEKRSDDDDLSLETSGFLRFFDNDEVREREDTFDDISYASTEGLGLGRKIGSGDKSIPKVGTATTRAVLEALKDSSDTVFNDVMEREGSSPAGEHVLYRRRGISYYINPLLEDLYDPGERPSETKPVYFEDKLDRDTAFLILQSSLFYLYWMAYGDERHLNWTEFKAMPFPDEESLNEKSDEIHRLADLLWSEMADRWVGGSREVIRQTAELKPIMDAADDLLGPMYGLDKEQIEAVKKYQEQYRLSSLDDPESEQVVVEQATTGE